MRTTSHARAHYYGIFDVVHVAEADIIWDHVTSCLFLGYMPVSATWLQDYTVVGMQDGSIQYEVKLTGCLSTSILSEGEGMDPTHGTLIGPHLNAQLHQHYFCVRLDMAVDDPDGGAALTISEVMTP